MKNRIAPSVVLFASLLSFNAWAVSNGPYLGIMAGPTTNNAKTVDVYVENPTSINDTTVATPKRNQVGFRIFGGNQIVPYAAIEAGLDLFSSIDYSTNVDTCSNTTTRIAALDIVGKAILPLGRFNVFAKGGGAGFYVSTSGDFNPSFDPTDTTANCSKRTTKTKFVATYSLGGSFDLNQNWVADISATRYQINSNLVSNATFYALGISYHFVDKYCGQFLCDD